MTPAQRKEKIRSAAAHAAALSEARKAIKHWKYGNKDRREPNKTDISFGWGQTDWAEK